MSCNFMTAVTINSGFGAQKIKSDTVSTISPYISHEVMGPDAMIFVFFELVTHHKYPRLYKSTFIQCQDI